MSLGVLFCALSSEQGDMSRLPSAKSSVSSQHCPTAPQESVTEHWGELTFCSLRAPLLLLPQNRKGCEVLMKVSFQNSSSSQRGWLIEGLEVAQRGSWNGPQLGWHSRERKQAKRQAGLLQFLKLLLSEPPLLLSTPIRCPVAPSIQGYCTGDHSSLLPCYHPPTPREAAVSKPEEENFSLAAPLKSLGVTAPNNLNLVSQKSSLPTHCLSAGLHWYLPWQQPDRACRFPSLFCSFHGKTQGWYWDLAQTQHTGLTNLPSVCVCVGGGVCI